MPQGHRQPVPAVSARRRLLVAVEPAGADAPTLVLAGRAVRHPQAAADQGRRPHRRDENQDQGPPADQRTRASGYPPPPRSPAAPGDLTAGAVCPGRALFPQPSAPLRPTEPPPRCGGDRPARQQQSLLVLPI